MSDSRHDEPIVPQDARSLLNRSLSKEAAYRIRVPSTRTARLTRDAEEPAINRAASADYMSIKGVLQERLLAEIGDKTLTREGDSGLLESVRDFTRRILETENIPLNETERDRLAEELVEETMGLGPLAPLMADPAVSDILVNSPEHVYVERFGRIEKTNVRFRDEEHIVRVIERI